MSNVIKFPDRMKTEDSPYSDGLSPLLGIPHLDLFGEVIVVNDDLFHNLEAMTTAENVHLFLDPAYPATVLADVGPLPGNEDAKGLYYVDLTTYRLIKLSNCPLVHFK